MWDRFKQTHNPKAVSALVILVILFGIILSGAIGFGVSSYIKSVNYKPLTAEEPNISPIITQTVNNTLPVQTRNGQTEFTLPQLRESNGPTSYTAIVNCTVTGTFVQNSPSNLTVDILFPAITQADLNISAIYVQPINALPTYKDWTSPTGYSPLTMSSNFLILWQTENYGALQIWTSSIGNSAYFNNYICEDSGLLNLKITIYAEPTEFAYNYTNWANYTANYVPFVTTVSIPNTYMTSIESVQIQQTQDTWQQSMLTQTQILQSIMNQSVALQKQYTNQQKDWKNQQDISAEKDFSLTLFVLALMIFDVIVVVYDHSVDERRKANYENKQRETNNHNPLQTIDYETV